MKFKIGDLIPKTKNRIKNKYKKISNRNTVTLS